MTIIFETKRLILKQPVLADFNELLLLRTNPEVMQYIGTGDIQTEEQVKEFIDNAKSYADEYGLGFYSVFEKESNDFVGQAGLFHLGFNVNQPDIELAYRLHSEYWNKGYATELAKALIEYGFNKFSLPKIVAIVHPENSRSRRVMEKAGMSYHGMIDFKGRTLPCYEIFNEKIDFNEIKLIPANLNEYSTIQNMGRFYVYDMSEYLGKEKDWEIPEDGLYECIDFKKYWEDNNSFPFLIRYQNEIAGFVIVDKKGSSPEIDFNMAQFFILRKFKHKKMGRYVVEQCFIKFPGIWEVMVNPGNEGAYRFWRSTIKKFTNNNFTEYTRDIAHFNNNRKNIFKLDSRIVLKDHVDIVAYDPEWPTNARTEINKIREMLPSTIIDIQHVGSTAIPGMPAKPIIDIQIAAKSLEEMKIIAIPALQKMGYEYWYENPDPERMFFVKGMPPFGEKRTHHVHIVEPTSKHWSGKINFRDYLIAHPEVALEYQQLKFNLAKKFTYDREGYTNAKAEFINRILQLAKNKK